MYSNNNKKSISPSSLIVDRKNITHPQDMAEHFNNFSTSVGKEIYDNIPPTKNNFKNYLKTWNPNNFILSVTTTKEISEIVQTLKLNKCTVPKSSLKVLKSIKGIMSVPFCDLINKSFTSGVFPSMCKIAKIIHMWRSWGTPQNFFVVFIGELEKQIILKKPVKVGQ